jgi:apolipoprotein N-acyltransferase
VAGALLASELAPLAWVALVPLLLALRGTATRGEAFLLGLVTGTVSMCGIGWWLVPAGVHPAGWTLGMLVGALYSGLFGLLAEQLTRSAPRLRLLSVPAAWTLLEFARTHVGWLATPWGLLGYSQVEAPAVLPLAAIAGVYGLGFVIVGFNAVVAEAVALGGRAVAPGSVPRGAPRALTSAGVISVLLLLWLAVPLVGASSGTVTPEDRRLRVAVVQGGTAEADWTAPQRADLFARYAALTREVAATPVDLVVWPESAVPAPIPADLGATRILGELAQEIGSHLLVSTTGRDKASPGHGSGPAANSSFLFSPTGEIIGRYDKIKLLPFNEYVPLRHSIPWPGWIVAPDHASDAVAGKERTVLSVGDARFSILICFENFFASEFRASARQDVDFVVSMTNESFTELAIGHRQMLAMNVLRAVENGTAVVRAATTGVSAVIGPDGRIAGRVQDKTGEELDVVGTLVQEIPLRSSPTPYSLLGDWLVALLAGVVAAALLAPRLGGTRRAA